jgi:pimeloyl-ACP methyl ester carboxylesterase
VAVFVLVHGGWGGGWERRVVARRLGSRGHDVFTPTLTGLGERSHLLRPHVSLSTHVEDVAALLRYENLRDVVLSGHSYSGMVVTGVADLESERLRCLVYIDAFVPRSGQALVDLLPDEFVEEAVRRPARERGDGWRVPFPFYDESVRELGRAYADRMTDQPLRTFEEPLRTSGAGSAVPRAYVRCTEGKEGGDIFAGFAERAQAAGWTYREIAALHDVQVAEPERLADILDHLGDPFSSTSAGTRTCTGPSRLE